MIFSYDAFNRLDIPYVYLAQPDKTYIGTLQAHELHTGLCLNNISEVTFKINKFEDNVGTMYYDEVEQLRLVEVTYIGWFQITSINEVGTGINAYKEITALSLENELTTKILNAFGSLGVETDEQGGLDRYVLYDPTDKAHSILHIVLEKAPTWRIGHIDDDITTESRAFTNDSVDAYSFLTGDVSTEFDCIFQFNTFTKTISAYTLENLGTSTDIYLSYENLIKQIDISFDSADIKTIMHVSGGDYNGYPLTISDVNPTGNNYIANFSFYKAWMSSELSARLTQYENDYNSLTGNYTNQLDTLAQLYEDLEYIQHRVPLTITVSDNENVVAMTTLVNNYQAEVAYRISLGGSMLGNIDLNDRKIIINPDGSYSTIDSGCQEYLIGTGTAQYYIIIHFTTILLTGDRIEGDPLFDYLDGLVSQAKVLAGTSISEMTDLINTIFHYDQATNHGNNIIFKIDMNYLGARITKANIKSAINVAVEYDISLHNDQATLYDNEAEYFIALTKLAKKNKVTINEYINSVEYINTNQRVNDWTQFGLVGLQSEYDYYSNYMSVYLYDSTSAIYKTYKGLRNQIEAELKIRQAEYDAKLASITIQQSVCSGMVLDLEDYLGQTLYKELSTYAHYTEFTDDTFIVTDIMTDAEILDMKLQLFNMANTELNKICHPNYTMKVSSINFTTIPEFIKFTNQLYLGNLITIDHGNDVLVEARLLKIDINWDDLSSFELTFSSKNRLDEKWAQFAEIQQQASSAATAATVNGTGWNLAKKQVTPTKLYMDSALNASKQKLQNSDRQTFVVGETGAQMKRYLDDENDYSPNQLWLTNNQIALTDDAWDSVKMAIGELTIGQDTYYGVCAPVIIGKILISEILNIENADSSIVLNEDGARFKNCNITIEKGSNTILLSGTEGIAIYKDATKTFYVDTTGNLHIAGSLEACNGTFTGELVAATGTFTGTVTASEFIGGNIQSMNYYTRDEDGKLILTDNLPTKTGEGAYFDLTSGTLELNGTSTYGWMTTTQSEHQGRVYFEGGRLKVTAFTGGSIDVGKSLYISNEGISTTVDASTSPDGEIAVNVIDIRSDVYKFLNPLTSKTNYSNGLTLQTYGSPVALRSIKGRAFINPDAEQGVYDITQTSKSNKFSFALNPKYLVTNGIVNYNVTTDNTAVANSKGDGLLLFGKAETQSNGSLGNLVALQFSADADNRYIKVKSGSGNDSTDLADLYCRNLYAENVTGGGGDAVEPITGAAVNVINQTITISYEDGTTTVYTVTEDITGLITLTDDAGHSFEILNL